MNSTEAGGVLRPIQSQDLAVVLEWRNHPSVRSSMYSQHEISPTEHMRWFKSLTSDSSRVAMILELDNSPSGFVQFNELSCGRVADWGFYRAPDAKKGTARILGVSALDYGFSELGYHKVCGQVIAFNKQSISFHESLGFVEEGRLRDQYHDGTAFHDVLCFGIFESDWLRRRSV